MMRPLQIMSVIGALVLLWFCWGEFQRWRERRAFRQRQSDAIGAIMERHGIRDWRVKR